MAINTQQLSKVRQKSSAVNKDLRQSGASQQQAAANEAVHTTSAKATFSRMFSSTKLTDTDRMFFTEQLALLLDTGNSLLESLQALATHGQNPALQLLIEQLSNDIQQGMPFSSALSKHPNIFSNTYCHLVKASEQGGFMSDVLEELMEMDEKRSRLQATMVSALSYPIFLLSFSFLVVLFVLIVVFPKFADMFESIADDLPATTKTLMWFSESMIAYWPVYLVGTIASIAAAILWKNSAQGSRVIDGLKLKTPIIRDIFSELYLVQSMRVMALSLEKGVSVMDTLASCRDVVSNRHYQDFFRDLETAVDQGSGLSPGFRQSHFIPDLVKQMVSTGEMSGSLPKVMARIAVYYERQLDKRLTAVSKAAEPIMLLVMGVVVGVLVSSLILPIFQMSRATG